MTEQSEVTAWPEPTLHVGDLWGTRTGNHVRVEIGPDMTPRLRYTNFEPGMMELQYINQESVAIFMGFKPVLATRGAGQQVWPAPTQPERSEVTDLLSALLLEAKKTNALLNLMATREGVEGWRIYEALRDAEHGPEAEYQK